MNDFIPTIKGNLKSHLIELPSCIEKASGIRINGKLLKSLAYTTDVAIIKNINANGIIAVYPFTPLPVITQALIEVADVPVFCGVGGGQTTGKRSQRIAIDAEMRGAAGVVVNAPTPNSLITKIVEALDVPLIVTVVREDEDFGARLMAGAEIFNVSCASRTAEVVSVIRKQFPDVPIIATGGPTEKSITDTINAGANCITYTPPTSAEIFRVIMENYREM